MFELPSDPSALLGLIESTHREESTLVARRLAAVAALLRHRVGTAERPEREYAEKAEGRVQRDRAGGATGPQWQLRAEDCGERADAVHGV